jgi:hypothetical protein
MIKNISKRDRAYFRRLLRSESYRLGYGKNGYHDSPHRPGGPQDWPYELRAVIRMLDFLSDENMDGDFIAHDAQASRQFGSA